VEQALSSSSAASVSREAMTPAAFKKTLG